MNLNLTATEAEALAYLAGKLEAAALLGRISDLQRALGQAVVALEEIQKMPDRHRTGAAAEALAQIESVTHAEGITK
jgi:hypothetical protein